MHKENEFNRLKDIMLVAIGILIGAMWININQTYDKASYAESLYRELSEYKAHTYEDGSHSGCLSNHPCAYNYQTAGGIR